MTLLSREAILAAADLPRELLEVPEWGGSVWVGTMSGLARDEFEQAIRDGGNGRALVASFCIQDEQGNRLFSAADAEALGAKSAIALTRVVRASLKLNKLGDLAIEDAKGN